MPSGAIFRKFLGRNLMSLAALGHARCVARDLRWGEGPVWFNGAWIFSDIPNNRMLRWNANDGLGVFRTPSHFANGNTLAADGSLLTCEHGMRRVSRTTGDGAYRVLCDRFDGRKLNSPNDVIQHPDGSIWFTDPTYGIVSDVEGYLAQSEQSANRVYRLDAATSELSGEVEHLKMPNGLCLSPDCSVLYVADSGAAQGPDTPPDPAGPREVYRFEMNDGHVTSRGEIFARASDGVPDGIRCDDEGFVWVSTGRGAECFDQIGRHVGTIETPQTLSNLAFGGQEGRSLMLTLADSAWVVTV